jgi:hypothetical protein
MLPTSHRILIDDRGRGFVHRIGFKLLGALSISHTGTDLALSFCVPCDLEAMSTQSQSRVAKSPMIRSTSSNRSI